MGSPTFKSSYDVVILGAGLAGLTLARQLLLQSHKSVLLLEKRSQIPPARQKVGEATVQVRLPASAANAIVQAIFMIGPQFLVASGTEPCWV